MYFIYRQVHKTQKRLTRYSINGVSSSHNLGRSGNNTSQVATQAILYSIAFLITWMPSTLWSVAHWFKWKHFGLDYAAGFCEPLQGLWNLIIFARHRNSTKRKVRKVLHKIVPCLVSYDEVEDLISESSIRRRSSARRHELQPESKNTENTSNHHLAEDPSVTSACHMKDESETSKQFPLEDSPGGENGVAEGDV
jgi:hypothetical protein